MNDPADRTSDAPASLIHDEEVAPPHWREEDEAEAIAEAELPHAPADLPEPLVAPWRERATTIAAVSAGGMLGANARYLVGVWEAGRWASSFPWGTLLINVSGSFVLGLYLTLVTERFAGRATTRLFFATGFLGAYTTFSTFGYDTAHFIQTGRYGQAGLNVAASLIAGMLGVIAGSAVANARR